MRELAALGVAGYVNEYSAVQHILPSLAPHLFPDNFNRRGSPRVVLGIPVQYRFGNTIAAALTLNLSHGGIAIRTTSPLDAGSKIKVRFRMPGRQDTTSTPRAASPGATAASAWASSSRRRSGQPDAHRQLRRRALLLQPKSLADSRSRVMADGASLAGILWRLAGVLALVFANGFFVAAEFAIVTVRKTRIDQLIAEGHRGARAVRRAVTDPDSYIAATQLGITMASIGLGWIGEPALASMIQPVFAFLPCASPRRRRTASPSRSRSPSSPRCTSCSASWRRRPSRSSGPRATALLVVKPTELFMKAVLAVHPAAERHGPRRREPARPAQRRRPRAGALGRGAEDARHRQPGSGRARRAGRADAPSRLRVRRPHRRPGDGAAHRARRRSPADASGDALLEQISARRLHRLPVYRGRSRQRRRHPARDRRAEGAGRRDGAT